MTTTQIVDSVHRCKKNFTHEYFMTMNGDEISILELSYRNPVTGWFMPER